MDKSNANQRSKQAKVTNFTYPIFVCFFIFSLAFLINGCNKLPPKTEKASCKPVVNITFESDQVYPVHLFYLRNTKQGLMEISISNQSSEVKTLHISYGFTEFDSMESQTVTVEANSEKKIQLTPFANKLMTIFSPINATIQLNVVDESNATIYSNSWNIKVNPCDEMPWRIDGQDYSRLIASWVTPKNESIEDLIGKAKEEYGETVNLVEKMNNEEFYDFVKAIFDVVRDEGVTYINSTISLGKGFTQRVRLPNLSIKTKSANCIDGSVLLASLFENVGLRPYIVLLPSHAIVGVARPNHTENVLFIETTLLGRPKMESLLTLESTFSAALRSGSNTYNTAYTKYAKKENKLFTIVDIHKAREDGIMPIN